MRLALPQIADALERLVFSCDDCASENYAGELIVDAIAQGALKDLPGPKLIEVHRHTTARGKNWGLGVFDVVAIEFAPEQFKREMWEQCAARIARRIREQSMPAQADDDPLESLRDLLSPSQGEIVAKMLTSKSGMTFDAIARIPRAFRRGNKSTDEAIVTALKRIQTALNEAYLGIALEYSTAKRRARLVHIADK